MTKQSDQNKLSIRYVISSTFAAAFGVQTGKNLKRDFGAGKPAQFLLAGIVFTILFVLVIVAVVHWII